MSCSRCAGRTYPIELRDKRGYTRVNVYACFICGVRTSFHRARAAAGDNPE